MSGHRRMRSDSTSLHEGFIGSVARFTQHTYMLDYVGFIVVLAAYILTQSLIEPFHRMFTLDNPAIQYPHTITERVPLEWLFAYACFLPLLILLLWVVIQRPAGHQIHVTVFGLLLSLTLTSFLTDVAKNAIGRPRPDLIARCKPELETPEHSLVTYKVCTETDHRLLHDGWRSFPSGHSSFAFSGLGFLALFFAGQFHVLKPGADLTRILMVLAPLLGAALIAISRCEDYRHDIWDVTAGSLLGMTVALLSYRKHYPPLNSPRSDSPYSDKVHIDYRSGFSKIKADEETARLSIDAFDADDPNNDLEAGPATRSSR